MRAKEFVTETTEVSLTRPSKDTSDVKTRAEIEKEGRRTHPTKPYKAKTFKSGKHGVPDGVHPHDTHSQNQDNNEYGSAKGEMADEFQAALPGAFSVETLANDFYGVYRLGLGLAAGDRNISSADNIGKHPFFMPFSPEEHDRFDKEIKRQGHKTKLRTTHNSQELSTVNQTSPIAKIKRNKYGI
jgi:hypothetical protein